MSIKSVATGTRSISMLAGNTAYDPAATWFIQRVTATGGETSLSFTSIPQTYKHLQIRSLAKDTVANTNTQSVVMQFNSDTGTNYAWHRIEGSGATVTASGSITQNWCIFSDASVGNTTANIFGVSITDILDYTNTSKNTTVRCIGGQDSNGSGYISLSSSLWLNTAAVTTITLKPGNTAFAAGSTFALYGIMG